jgi:hypothetical protein
MRSTVEFIPNVSLVRSLSQLLEHLANQKALDLSVPAVLGAFVTLRRYYTAYPQTQLISASLKEVLSAGPTVEQIQASIIWIR